MRSDTLDPADPFVACVRDIVGTLEDTAKEVSRSAFTAEQGKVGRLVFGKTYVSPTAKVISSGVNPGFEPSVPTFSLL